MAHDTLTTKEYWTEQISDFQPFEVVVNDFETVLNKYLPVNADFTCVEIGAYPGTNLCYLAKQFKYKPTAIEYRNDVEDIRRLFEYNNIFNLSIINKDFTEVNDLKFDIVTSFGFIEHFNDYETVIRRHVDILKPGGLLVLSVPHCRGLQAFFRRLILKKEAFEEIYKTHNKKIMDLEELKRNLINLQLEVKYCNFFMGGIFWIPYNSPKIKKFMKPLAFILNKLNDPFLSKIRSSRLYSPMMLSICKKNF